MKENDDTITPEDLDSSLRSIVGEFEQKASSTSRRLLPLLVGAGVFALIVAYLLGRRAGATRSTLVEIRRL